MTNTPAGQYNAKVYDDWEGVGEVTSLPHEAAHRPVDEIVLTGGKSGIQTAIVCPPTIYGPGRGPGNTDSDQWYKMAEHFISRGKGFQVGEGKNVWSYIHVHDLSNIYLSLVEAAANGGAGATWGNEGYYFAGNGEYVWGEMAGKIAQEAHKQGFLKSTDLDSVTFDEADKITSFGGLKWGTNSRGTATRARNLFGWSPTGDSPEKVLPDLVAGEARKLGITIGHAVVAAGDD